MEKSIICQKHINFDFKFDRCQKKVNTLIIFTVILTSVKCIRRIFLHSIYLTSS